MEAQTLQVRRTIRFPWMTLLVAVLLAATLAIGIGVAASRNDATTVPPRTAHTIGTGDVSGPTAYPGFVPSQRGPETKTVVRTATNGPIGPTAGSTAANGKPLP